MRKNRMSKKDEEKHIGELFIKEYNRINATSYQSDVNYLDSRAEKDFPDLKFTWNSMKLFAEVVRALNQKFEKVKDVHDDLDLIEVDAPDEVFVAIKKKDDKHYDKVNEIILLVNVEFYAERDELIPICRAIQRRGYKFKEIWVVWSDEKKSPLKLF